jgi:hypothetical protein
MFDAIRTTTPDRSRVTPLACGGPRPSRSGRAAALPGIAVLLSIGGCGFAPSVNVLGSFFPAWLLCIVIGVVLTIVSLRVLLAMQLAQHLGPPALVYPCLAGVWIFATWLVVFGS